MTPWLVVAALAAGTLALKVAGPVLAGGRQPGERLERVLGLFTPTLLAALVVVGTVTQGRRLVVDARLVGLLVAAVGLRLRLPLVACLVLAVGSTALVRFLAQEPPA